jgi:uncharacterized protein
MQISPFVIFVPHANGIITANLETGETLFLDQEEVIQLQQANDTYQETFSSKGFLVTNHSQAYERVAHRHRQACQARAIFNLTLLPTLACNFKCRYCFENHDRNDRMNDETAASVLALVRQQAARHWRINLSWFGGEPLLETKRIAALHPRIHKIAKENACELLSTITTNGYLLNADTARLLHGLNIHTIQITLDGNRQDHDANRITRTNEGTYDTIFANILTFLEINQNGNLVIRVNSTSEHVHSILEVLPEIPTVFRKRVSIHLHAIMNPECPSHFTTEYADELKHIYQKTRSLGFMAAVDNYLDCVSGIYCYAERSTSAVIDPAGNVYRCAYTNYDGKECIGKLQKNGTIKASGSFGDEWEKIVATEPEKCRSCQYLPICGFGCPRLRASEEQNQGCKNRFIFLADTLRAL